MFRSSGLDASRAPSLGTSSDIRLHLLPFAAVGHSTHQIEDENKRLVGDSAWLVGQRHRVNRKYDASLHQPCGR